MIFRSMDGGGCVPWRHAAAEIVSEITKPWPRTKNPCGCVGLANKANFAMRIGKLSTIRLPSSDTVDSASVGSDSPRTHTHKKRDLGIDLGAGVRGLGPLRESCEQQCQGGRARHTS